MLVGGPEGFVASQVARCVQAVMTFDLGCPVGDAAWAPYSASVFAGVGEDGRVQVSLVPRACRSSCGHKRTLHQLIAE